MATHLEVRLSPRGWAVFRNGRRVTAATHCRNTVQLWLGCEHRRSAGLPSSLHDDHFDIWGEAVDAYHEEMTCD